MNPVFHAAAGATLGALALGPGAAPSDLALCALAGLSPDGDSVLLLKGKALFSRLHRSATHGFLGLAAGALLAGGLLSAWGGWTFGYAAGLWLLAAAGHTVSDLFNRSGVALFYPFSSSRTRFPAVSWGSPGLTLCACLAVLAVLLLPGAARPVSLLAVAAYSVHMLLRLRSPLLQDAVSRWWFGRVFGPIPVPGETPAGAAGPFAGPDEEGR